MKNKISLTEQEEIKIIFDRAKNAILKCLWILQEQYKIENFDPDDLILESLEYYKLSVYYYNLGKKYSFTEKDMKENFQDLSKKIFDDILSQFKVISIYTTDKDGTRTLYQTYAFNVTSWEEATINDYTKRDISQLILSDTTKIEIVEFFSQKPLLVLNSEFSPFADEN